MEGINLLSDPTLTDEQKNGLMEEGKKLMATEKERLDQDDSLCAFSTLAWQDSMDCENCRRLRSIFLDLVRSGDAACVDLTADIETTIFQDNIL